MKQLNKNGQKGNVLFLILIAVALFAALSYAVTQSSRSGGDASRETNILNSAQITQYPISVRTAVMRLVIDGIQDTNLLFNRPGSYQTGSEVREIFHPLGGGAIYQPAPADIMSPSETGDWFFNMGFEVPGIGLSTGSSISGNELIAFLPGVTDSVCRRINQEAGIASSSASAPPYIGSDISGGSVGDYDFNVSDALTDYTNAEVELDNASDDFTDHPFGCFRNGASGSGQFVFYSVILER